MGNRLSSLGVSPYSYNTSNELTSTPSGSYTYDANGNTLTDAAGRSYTWDFENRLKQVTLPSSGGTVTFLYDPFGRRIEKVYTTGANPPTTTTTNYLYDGDNVIETVDQNGNLVAKFAQGQNIDEPLAESVGGATYDYEQDGLGSVTSLTASNATIAQSYTYDSFGNTTNSSGNVTNPFRYTGRDFDSETGLYYYRARYYDPTTGRFLSEDAAGFAASTDFYNYASSDPTNWVDPTGLAQCHYSISEHTLTCVENSPPPVGPRWMITVGPTDVSSGDNQDGQYLNNPQCSGRKYKDHGPIEPGEYKMNPDPRPGNEGQYRLEPVPSIPGWRVLLPGWLPGSMRSGFRLHLGSRTHGCINVLYNDPIAREQYRAMQQMLDSEGGNNWLLVSP